jgi:hypothetical protein
MEGITQSLKRKKAKIAAAPATAGRRPEHW